MPKTEHYSDTHKFKMIKVAAFGGFSLTLGLTFGAEWLTQCTPLWALLLALIAPSSDMIELASAAVTRAKTKLKNPQENARQR